MTAMSQEEMVTGARTVAAGLEALKAEHAQLLAGLAANTEHDEKVALVRKSIDAIELGLGEAQVRNSSYIFLPCCADLVIVICFVRDF